MQDGVRTRSPMEAHDSRLRVLAERALVVEPLPECYDSGITPFEHPYPRTPKGEGDGIQGRAPRA
jgi:hypothetical protein